MIWCSIKQKSREIIPIDGRTILAGLPISSLPLGCVAGKDTGGQSHKEALLGQLPSQHRVPRCFEFVAVAPLRPSFGSGDSQGYLE